MSLHAESLALVVGLSLLVGPDPRPVPRHETGQSYIFLTVDDSVISGRLEIPVRDLNRVLSLNLRGDSLITDAELAAHVDSIHAYVLDNVHIAWRGGPLELRTGEHRLFGEGSLQFVVLPFTLDTLPESPQYLDVEYGAVFDVDPQHRGMLVVETNWKAGALNNEANVALIFGPGDTRQRLDLTSSSVWRGFISLVELGNHHIWIGIDHILFLMALLLPAVLYRDDKKWQPVTGFRPALINVVKIVTLFTIAHSVTLSLAALDVVQLPPRLVESVIAISIAAAAVNIVIPLFKGHVLWVVFGFGLFHGFGFASVLSTMGIPGRYMAVSLAGFNIGVEIGQLLITCLVFPLLFAIRRWRLYPSYGVKIGAGLLMFVSLYWFTERAFEVDIPLRAIVTLGLSPGGPG